MREPRHPFWLGLTVMTALDLVKLPQLMALCTGSSRIVVGLIDGPVEINHPDLSLGSIREISGGTGACRHAASAACVHGTYVAGILCAKRGSSAPAICPDCTLLVRSVFAESVSVSHELPSATPEELAVAILQSIDAGAMLLNLSLTLAPSASREQWALMQALDHAASRGVIIVAAAGNQSIIGSTVITAHPWVISVTASDLRGAPLRETNFGHSIGRRGLRAPGEQITSLGAEGHPLTLGGTSAATPFVTGAIALVWSEFPTARAAELRWAFLHAHSGRRTTVMPPLLDAWAAYRALLANRSGNKSFGGRG